MRYTLRLLTLDQLGRATALICAPGLERKARGKTEEKKLGDWPFEIGLGVVVCPRTRTDFDACVVGWRCQFGKSPNSKKP